LEGDAVQTGQTRSEENIRKTVLGCYILWDMTVSQRGAVTKNQVDKGQAQSVQAAFALGGRERQLGVTTSGKGLLRTSKNIYLCGPLAWEGKGEAGRARSRTA